MNAFSTIRRSPVHDCLQELNPQWTEVHGMKVALRCSDAASELRLKAELALCDLSCLPKLAIKGPQALAWLEQAGIPVPDSVYRCNLLEDGGLVIRTDRHEIFVEEGLGNTRVAALDHDLRSRPSGVYLVPRQDASFLLSGVCSHAVLRETCGVDFSRASGSVVLTRVAGVSCMLLPLQASQTRAFRCWLDSSYGAYLWEALLEIVRDHGGGAVGLAAFYPSLGQSHSLKGDPA